MNVWNLSQHGWNSRPLLLFSRSVVFDSLWPHGLQHIKLPFPSPFPRAYSNSCPLSRWCHPTISSSVIPFSFPQSFPASGSFLMSWLFASGGQSIGASASASVFQRIFRIDFLRMDWLDLLAVQGTLKSLLQHHSSKYQFFRAQPSWSNSHIHTWLLEKGIMLDKNIKRLHAIWFCLYNIIEMTKL